MTVTCNILLLNSKSIYLTGETVNGVVKITIQNNTKTFNKITVSFKGKGKLHILDKWQRKNGGRRNNYNYEIYEDIENVLVLSAEGVKYNPGTYIYPFQFIIPEDIPPSFGLIRQKGRYHIKCRIKHRLYAKFERVGFMGETKKIKEEILIIAGVKPRVLPVPLIYGNQKTIVGINCKKSFINIKAFIEKSTLKPGDKVKFSYEVTNNSNINILTVRVKLLEAYVFKFTGTKVKVADNTSDLVFRSNKIMRQSKYSESFEIDLPKTSSSVDFCKIVKRDYHVQICVVLPFLRRSMVLVMPVLVDAKSDETIADMSNTNFLKNFSDAILKYEKKKK